MIKNETRESAHLRSRVKDLSAVPNLVNFTGLFAAITPIAKLEKNPDTNCYEPILIRDVDSLIANFGDPRIDPEKYIDLYSIMQVVANGTSCYVAKVDSGDPGIYEVAFVADNNIVTDKATQDADIRHLSIDDRDTTTVSDVVIDSKTHKPTYTVDDAGPLYDGNKHGFSNKYVISEVFGFNRALVTTQAAAASKQVTSSGNTITFTAKTAGSAGNNIKVKVLANEDSPNNFDFFINDEKVLESVADFNTLNSELVSVTVDGVPFVVENDAADSNGFYNLAGGKDAVVERDSEEWRIDDSKYSYRFDPDEENDGKFKLHIIVNDDKKPDTLIIKNAELDPDFGHEPITLSVHLDSGTDDKYHNTNNYVFDSNDLIRKYTILQVKAIVNGTPDTIIGSDQYTVDWETTNDNKYKLHLVFLNNDDITSITDPEITSVARQTKSIVAYSSIAEDITIECKLSQAKPYSLELFYLDTVVKSASGVLGTAKIKLEQTTTNQSIVNNLNAVLQTYARFELVDASTKNACEVNEGGKNSIVKELLDKYAKYGSNGKRNTLSVNPRPLPDFSVLSKPNFKVTLQNYIDAQEQFKDRKYVGCMMADMAAPVTDRMEKLNPDDDNTHMVDGKAVLPLDYDERRSLHYYLKQIACERKDTTVILSTPLWKDHTSANTFLTKDEVCNWVASQGDYVDLWEYGQGATTDYATQSFYLEMYYSWLNQQCTKIENGLAKSVKVKTPPANIVINNILTSWRERGVQYPVAGDQYGILPETCAVIQNPKTKLDRDQFVQYRINPIWDTGTRGVQIYGNETLNAGYTDLNAAHIARTLVYIRGRIDEYTETLKFSLNNSLLWDKWKTYVTQYILEPLISVNALSEYRIAMGEDTTSPEERANRQVNGLVQLIFYQSAEIFDLTYTVYSSSTTIDEAMANT